MASVAIMVGGALVNALAFSGSNYLFSKLGQGDTEEQKRHDTTWPSSSGRPPRLHGLSGEPKSPTAKTTQSRPSTKAKKQCASTIASPGKPSTR